MNGGIVSDSNEPHCLSYPEELIIVRPASISHSAGLHELPAVCCLAAFSLTLKGRQHTPVREANVPDTIN